MFRYRMFPIALCVLCLCALNLAEENKDSGKAGAHRLNWGGGATASGGYHPYPGAYPGAGEFGPYVGAYPQVPIGYPPVAYPGSYYPPSPWAFKTNEGKKLPE